MPELPEVEAARRVAQKVAAGRRIVEAYVADDPIVFEGVAPARVRRALVGRRVKAVRRHGKHIVPRPGDRLPLEEIEVDVVSGDGATLTTPLEGAGEPNAAFGQLAAIELVGSGADRLNEAQVLAKAREYRQRVAASLGMQ